MIGIIGAMGEEVATLKSEMSEREERVIAGMKFCKGRIEGQDVVVVKSGIGKVNMAACAQILIDQFKADALINTGVAGSLDARIDIGDIVLATDALHHDMDTSAFGDQKGWVPRMDVMAFPCDEELIRRADSANARVNPEIRTHLGRVLTGDQFVSEPARKEEITELFSGLCCEMEGAAMAQVAYLNRVPCLIIRAISDKADGSASENYIVFEKKAIAHTTRLLFALLADMRDA